MLCLEYHGDWRFFPRILDLFKISEKMMGPRIVPCGFHTINFDTLQSIRKKTNDPFIGVGACNSNTKPMSWHFDRLIYF